MCSKRLELVCHRGCLTAGAPAPISGLASSLGHLCHAWLPLCPLFRAGSWVPAAGQCTGLGWVWVLVFLKRLSHVFTPHLHTGLGDSKATGLGEHSRDRPGLKHVLLWVFQDTLWKGDHGSPPSRTGSASGLGTPRRPWLRSSSPLVNSSHSGPGAPLGALCLVGETGHVAGGTPPCPCLSAASTIPMIPGALPTSPVGCPWLWP